MSRLLLPLLGRLATAVVLVLVLRFLLDQRAPAWDEPLPLRWLRKLAEHPIRAPVALALLRTALPSPRGRKEEAEPPPPPFPGP